MRGRITRATRIGMHSASLKHASMRNRRGQPIDPGEDNPDEALTNELGRVDERTLELREEELVARKELRDMGEVTVRTQVDEVPGRLEVDALREEVEIEREPVSEVVSERGQPWEEDGVLVVPVYEEQLVVSKRLVLKERIRIRRVRTTDRRLFEDMLRRERLVVDDPSNTGMVHERYPSSADSPEATESPTQEEHPPGVIEQFVRKVLE
jgi:uncharacterized protein (TIGR02271 family)